jgi:uncharacterized protein YxjI
MTPLQHDIEAVSCLAQFQHPTQLNGKSRRNAGHARPAYEIYRGSQLAAVVKKSLFTFLHCKFTVDVPGPDDLEAEGDFLDHEYSFSRGGRTVATVSKQWFSWTDTYGVEIADGEDDILILASTVVIDMACHGDQQGRRN